MTGHNHAQVRVRPGLFLAEESPDDRLRAHEPEIIFRHHESEAALQLHLAPETDVIEIHRRHVAEHRIRSAEREEFRVGKLAEDSLRIPASGEDANDFLRFVGNRGPQQRAVDQGKDSRRNPNRYSQCQDGNGREPGRFSEQPKSQPEISKHAPNNDTFLLTFYSSLFTFYFLFP